MNISDLRRAAPALKILANANVPFNVAYRLSIVIPKIDACLAKFQQTYMELCRKYGTLSEDGKTFTFNDTEEVKNATLFNQEQVAMLTEELDFAIPKILVSELQLINNGDNIIISPNDLATLNGLILFGSLEELKAFEESELAKKV